MNIRKTTLMLLLLAVCLVGTLALAHQERTNTANQSPMQAAELEKLAAQPSIEQDILQIAAEKLRQERKPMTTVELPFTAKVRKVSAAPPCWYEICVNYGTKKLACKYQLCLTTNPD